MQKNIVKKGLSVAVIFLFIAVSFQSINAENIVSVEKKSLDNNTDLVEVTISTCRIDSIDDQTEHLTKQQLDILENIFNKLKNDLKNADTKEETLGVYYQAIDSLDQYGLLPNELDAKKAKDLVTKIDNRHINFISESASQKSNENILCLVTGVTTDSWIGFVPFSGIGLITIMGFGTYHHFLGDYSYYPAQGWVYTFGLKGKINWEGALFYGQYFRFLATLMYSCYCGGIGFTGLKYLAFDTDTLFGYYFIGSTLKIKLGPNYPTSFADQVMINPRDYKTNLHNNQKITFIKSLFDLDRNLLRSLLIFNHLTK